ncbi:DUF2147 domain-containing protein [Massilia sp. BJB1822]|uniref:DUF2147 domain-containing protein n=1 Tax=Massilia sp. BJB1822 TaxID=2744470 RepID=UPI001592C226|nr:DUF2147 domain-containing protein [Massilia sp. BJB1822]NVD97276.1 DUF2147 domain-containing protein [Massilia sp. BJB1822]
MKHSKRCARIVLLCALRSVPTPIHAQEIAQPERTAAIPAKATPALLSRTGLSSRQWQDLVPAPEREWKQHIVQRKDGESYDCALSFALAGDLRLDGYKALRVGGRTFTLSKTKSGVAP